MTTPEERLAQLQQELKDLKAEYTEFAYIVSHDLNGPFRAIEGIATIIANRHVDDFDEKTREQFNYIINGAQEGKAILAALVEYSRLDTKETNFIECDCTEIVNTIKHRLSTLINDSQANIACESLPIVLADKDQLSLLFYHLIHNALLYRKVDTPPQIEITCQDTDNAWKFSIRDNGIGIKSNLTDKVFKALRRGVSSKNYPGMGMGLTIAQKVVQRHCGTLSLSTEWGSGSTVNFTIAK